MRYAHFTLTQNGEQIGTAAVMEQAIAKKKPIKSGGKRAAIYARYSSHNQREASIEQQVDMCVNLAQRMGLTVVKTYSDKAISGKTDKCGSPMVGICGTSRNGDRHYYYLCQGKHRHECDKKNERKDEIEAKVIDALKRFILDEKTIDRIMAGFEKFMIDLRGMSTLAAMEDELAEVNKGIANILKAIESGLPFTEATKDRMIELEERKKELVQDIDEEKRFFQKASPEQVRFSIEYYRDKNLDNREYLRELLNTFVRAIYVFDDHFKIVINNGLGDDIEIPLSDLQEDYSDDDFSGADVRTDATKGHQTGT